MVYYGILLQYGAVIVWYSGIVVQWHYILKCHYSMVPLQFSTTIVYSIVLLQYGATIVWCRYSIVPPYTILQKGCILQPASYAALPWLSLTWYELYRAIIYSMILQIVWYSIQIVQYAVRFLACLVLVQFGIIRSYNMVQYRKDSIVCSMQSGCQPAQYAAFPWQWRYLASPQGGDWWSREVSQFL